MNDGNITEIDKALEIALTIRGSESGYARDHRSGPVFGYAADNRRLDAFTLGLLDALAARISTRHDWLPLLAYLHQLNENGPGEVSRNAYRQMCKLKAVPGLARYVAGGRHHIRRVMAGETPDVGRFARLLSEENDGF
jgi:hypothetical protein